MTASEVVQRYQSVSDIAKQAKLNLSDAALATLVLAMTAPSITVNMPAPVVTINPTDLGPVTDALTKWCSIICTQLKDLHVTVEEGRPT